MVRSTWIITLCGLAVLLAQGTQAKADFIFTIDNSAAVTAGSSGFVSVFVRSTEALGQNFDGYNASISFAPAGLPTGITFSTPLISNGVLGNEAHFPAGPGDFNIAADSGIAAFAPNTNVKLFDLNLDVAPGTAPGSYAMVFNAGASDITNGINPGTISQFNSGSFNVVPEPSSLAVLGLLTGVMAVRRRRRQV